MKIRFILFNKIIKLEMQELFIDWYVEKLYYQNLDWDIHTSPTLLC